MDKAMDEVQEIVDRERIRACIAQIARAEDRRDAELLGNSFWPEASVDFGIFEGPLEKYVAWVVPGSPAVVVTQHFLGQSCIELAEKIGLVETHVLSYHRLQLPEREQDMVIGGRYLDRLEKRAGRWRVSKRSMLYDWYQELGPSVDWSSGLMGMPFSGRHYTGKATGDFSALFFAETAGR